MVFNRVMRAFGAGGPSVDTVLASPDVHPGQHLRGGVRVVGGDHDVDIEHLSLGLVTRVETDGHDGAAGVNVEFHRVAVGQAFRLAAGQRRDVAFELPVPWETPVTDVYGKRLPGMTMGLRTELAVARAVDKSELDALSVHPLPAQERILDAFSQLGFHFKGADLEHGHVAGLHHDLPFHQEIEFFPPPPYARGVDEVALTFLADGHGVEVILEFDKRSRLLGTDHETYGRFRVEHGAVDGTDWPAVVDGWLRQSTERYARLIGGGGPGDGHRYGGAAGAVGAVAAGAAGGLFGGMLLGEVPAKTDSDDVDGSAEG